MWSQEKAVEPAVPAEILREYGEEEAINVEGAWEAFSEANEGLVGSVEPRTVTFAAALTFVRSLSERGGGKAALAAARQAFPRVDSYELFRLCALRETMQGRPDAAFLFLVGAFDLRPNDPDALFNMASVLAGLGHANEALALLDELERRKQTPQLPMGLTGRDGMDYLRGYCLSRRGETARARPLLEPIHARQPLLAEAPRLLALLDEEEDKDHRRNFLLGVWRRTAPIAVASGVSITGAEPDPFTAGAEVALDVRSFVELDKGTRGVLPGVRYASSPESCKPAMDVIDAKMRQIDKDSAALSDEMTRIKPRGYRHTDTSLEETWGYRMFTLLGMLEVRDAKLRELQRAAREADKAAVAARDQISAEASKRFADALQRANEVRLANRQDLLNAHESGQLGQPIYAEALSKAAAPQRRLEQAYRDYFAEWHLLATALAGRVGDASWREVFRLSIERQRLYYQQRLLNVVSMHAFVGHYAYADFADYPPSDDPVAQGMAPCDSSRSVGFGINKAGFGEVVPFDLGVELTCEGFSVEAAIDVMPMLSVSGELGFDTKGQFSAFVDPKFDASYRGTGMTMKDGFFLTANRDGVQEVGAKIEVKGNSNQGPFAVSQKIAETSVSFLPAPRNAPPEGLTPLVFK